MSTLLCVPIMVRDHDSALADAEQAKLLGADLVEFRVDEFFDGSAATDDSLKIVRLVSQSPLPCIATCRPTWEGGLYDGDDMHRVSLFERLGTAAGRDEHPPRYIDVEFAAYSRSANLKQKINLAVDHSAQQRSLSTSLILSMHDFEGRPADFNRRLLAMKAEPAAQVLKIAIRARSIRDNLELFDVLLHKDRPTIALAMGEFGLMSRVLAPKFGGFITFASLRESSGTAPGQPTVTELLDLYRFRSIKPTTKAFGIIGWPISHSMSPLVHNAGFSAIDCDAVYVPLPVAAADRAVQSLASSPLPTASQPGDGSFESFKATVMELLEHPRLDFSGCSVTLPHKENLVRLALEQRWTIDEASRTVGAANTVRVERSPDNSVVAVHVSNTDIPAIVSCLTSRTNNAIEPLRDKRVAIIGAGGVGRGAAYALASMGARVSIFNRTFARAQLLADQLSATPSKGQARKSEAHDVNALPWNDFDAQHFDVCINCTSVGMKGGPDSRRSPITFAMEPSQKLPGSPPPLEKIAMDTVYTPVATPFLAEARAAGWRTIDGVSMFVAQAGLQFEAWTDRPAPRELFERLVRMKLA